MAPAQKGSAVRVWMCRGRRPVSFVTISRNMKDPPSHLRGLICWLATAVRRGGGVRSQAMEELAMKELGAPPPHFLFLPTVKLKPRHKSTDGWSALPVPFKLNPTASIVLAGGRSRRGLTDQVQARPSHSSLTTPPPTPQSQMGFTPPTSR